MVLDSNNRIFTIKIFFVLDALFIQYMPQKPAKFGIKFGTVCDTTTCFVLRAFPYVGKEKREVGLGEHVTLSLMEPYKKTFAEQHNDARYHKSTST